MSRRMHSFIAGMCQHVLPGYLEPLVFPDVQLRAVDSVAVVEWVRIVSVYIILRIVSCIQKCEERVDIYLKQDRWSARF
jgi:hypothetical protein